MSDIPIEGTIIPTSSETEDSTIATRLDTNDDTQHIPSDLDPTITNWADEVEENAVGGTPIQDIPFNQPISQYI